MPTIRLTLPRPHVAQQQVISEAKRFNVLCLGRRWGKTTLATDRLVQPALAGYPVAWFSPTYKMLSEVWRETVRILRPVIRTPNAQEHRLELITGGVVDMWSLDDPNAARGRKYRRAAIDEAAMIRALREGWEEVIRPTLMDYEGDAWFLSTPKGNNYFRELFERGRSGEPDWAAWQMPTSSNPFIAAGEIEEFHRTMPERVYQQEILAQFIADGGGVFRRVAEASVLERREPYGGAFIMGVDWGREKDFTVLSVVDLETRRQVDVDRFNRIDWAVQRDRLKAMQSRWQCQLIIAEQNSIGGPNIEALQRDGLPVRPFVTTSATKAAAVEALALALETGELQLLNDPTQLAELQAYEMERLPSGAIRYNAPHGQHDDTVIALALAWSGATMEQPSIQWVEV